MHSRSFDVIVLGGGPAGTAAALTLRHYSSLSVAVIEKSNYDQPRIGETLSPGVQGLLSYLKVWDDFVADGHQPSLGTSAAWGGSNIITQDFIFTPFGKGWHLDRRRFDRMLAQAVTQAGGTVLRKAQVENCQRTTANGWQLTIDQGSGPIDFQARFIVDATGKVARLVKSEGAKRQFIDRLIAIAGTVRFPNGAPPDTFTLIETCETGWWYSAKLPNASMIVAFMTDADIARKQKLLSGEVWRQALTRTTHTSERVMAGQLVGRLGTHAAHSSCLETMVGEGWLAAGDTAASHDPLSSSGIPRALDSGIHAARAIYDYLRHGRTSMLQAYEASLKQSFETYLATRAHFYKMETRWPEAPFWKRRQEVMLNPLGILRSRIGAGQLFSSTTSS